jgi:hypothetical protein
MYVNTKYQKVETLKKLKKKRKIQKYEIGTVTLLFTTVKPTSP